MRFKIPSNPNQSVISWLSSCTKCLKIWGPAIWCHVALSPHYSTLLLMFISFSPTKPQTLLTWFSFARGMSRCSCPMLLRDGCMNASRGSSGTLSHSHPCPLTPAIDGEQGSGGALGGSAGSGRISSTRADL